MRVEFHFYVLYSIQRDKYYIGYTGDLLEERLRRHNTKHKGFTGGVGDWEIIYTEIYLKKEDARNRELTVKAWKSRKMLEKLIGKS